MKVRKIMKVGSSIAVTLPPESGMVVGDNVVVTNIPYSDSILITKLHEPEIEMEP